MENKDILSPEMVRIANDIAEMFEREGWPRNKIQWVITIQAPDKKDPRYNQFRVLSIYDEKYCMKLMKSMVVEHEIVHGYSVDLLGEWPFVIREWPTVMRGEA